MNENNRLRVHVFCYSIVSAWRAQFSTSWSSVCPLLLCQCRPALTSSLLHLSGFIPVFLFCHPFSYSSPFPVIGPLTLHHHPFISFSPTLLFPVLLRKVCLPMAGYVHPITFFVQSISCQFSFSCIVLGVNNNEQMRSICLWTYYTTVCRGGRQRCRWVRRGSESQCAIEV